PGNPTNRCITADAGQCPQWRKPKPSGKEKAKVTCRVPVTASNAWPNFHSQEWKRGRLTGGSTGCNENAQLAPSEQSRSPRVRMEGWRQWRPGRKENLAHEKKNQRTDLTPTGLLMEGFIILYKTHCRAVRGNGSENWRGQALKEL